MLICDSDIDGESGLDLSRWTRQARLGARDRAHAVAIALPGTPIAWFENAPNRYLGMHISSECTVDALIVPFIIGAAWSVWHQVRLIRPLPPWLLPPACYSRWISSEFW